MSPEQIETIARELIARKEREQAVRQQLHEILMKGATPDEIKNSPVVAEMRKVDGENTAFLKQQIQAHGWPTAEQFGKGAAHAAFLIVQHSDDAERFAGRGSGDPAGTGHGIGA